MVKRKHQKIHHLWNLIVFILGLFILALAYNTLIIPNDIVVGGTTGLSTILNKIFGININLFVLIFGLALLVVSFLFLGWKTTKRNILGTLLYPLMLALTIPIAKIIIILEYIILIKNYFIKVIALGKNVK